MVFGNAGGGKSTLAKRLADLTRLSLYPLDTIQFRAGGGKVPHDEYLQAHADLLRKDEWIIDGFGCVASARELTPRYRQLVADVAASKRVHHARSPAEMTAFLDAIRYEYASA